MTSNSRRKGFAAVTARLLVLLVAVCMLLAVAPRLTEGFLPKASAASSLTSSSVSEINTFLTNNSGEVNILLNGDVDLNSGGIVVPAGRIVNLYMNGKTMTYSKDNWNTGSYYAFTNNEGATLNIYSGSASVPNLVSGNSLISVTNTRRDMNANSHNETAYVDIAAVKNSGTLTVNKSVKISVSCDLDYGTGGSSQNNSNVNSAATGIYNATNNATATLNAVEITSYANAYGVNANGTGHTYRPSTARAYSYGVYGGKVTVNGASKLSVRARVGVMEHTWNFDYGKGRQLGVAFGICSGQQIAVNGGDFEYSSESVHSNDGMKKGTVRIYMGGIAYSSVIPVMADGSITPFSGSVNQINKDDLSFSIFEATVGKMTTLPIAGSFFVANIGNFSSEGYDHYPNGTNSKGQFYDESGNVYDASATTSDGSHPTKIIHGAAEGTYRVHVVYRYWTSATKSQIYTADGNPGYSYKPTGDGTNIVDQIVQLNGLSGTNQYVKNKANGITYRSGAASKNDYYWKLHNLASTTTAAWFSDFDVTSSSNKGTKFKGFGDDSTNNSVGANAENPLYIFVDYYKVEPTDLVASVGSNNAATVTYTGDDIKASAINLKIRDSVTNEVYTSEYNVNFTDSSLIPVSYSWTGTTAANHAVSGSGEMPTDAGVYQVTLNIAADTVYDPNDCAPKIHKNRNALSYTFTLTISQASVTRGTLVDDVTVTYGTKLGDADHGGLALNSYVAKGVLNEDVEGTFSFTNSADLNAYKAAGTGTVSLTWTPVYENGAMVKNYKETTFTVAYTVNKAALVISPNAVEVQYGDPAAEIPFAITVNGLVGNDNNDSAKSAIAGAIDYMILVNSAYTYYSPDDVGVGAYNIRARVKAAEAPEVLANYTYSYADLEPGYDVNQLTVTKRALIVKATAVEREYAPDNYDVNVTYELVSGRYQADDVRFTTGTGSINPNTAGTQIVYGATPSAATACMTGAKAGNYQIAEIAYATGTSLTVNILKAVPSVNTPVVADMYYQRTATLSGITLASAGSSVEGSWTWVNPSQNPTVNTSAYAAKFVPTDSANYAEKVVDVTINVRPTPVKITYTGTVEYGDPVPNITAYTYTAEQDPSFSIDAVETTGNIQTTTAYRERDPVTEAGYAVNISLQNFVDSAGNYTFTAENGKITVVPRNIVFTVPSLTIEYGDNFAPTAANAEPTCDLSRLVGTDTLSSITNNGSAPSWSYSSDYNYTSNYQVGTYAIRAAMGFTTSPNYTVTVRNGVLTVAKASLTIKANNVTLPYNSEVPEDLATAFTFVGAKKSEGLDKIVKSGSIVVSTNYVKGAPVNAEGYPIVVDISGAVISNYDVTVENGKITVVKATPVVRTYPTATIVYGQTLADAVFTGGVIDGDVPGSFVYNAASTRPAYSNEPYTNYTAAFVPDDTANYNSVTGLTIALTVNKMPVTGSLAVTGIPMKGETLTVDVSGLTPDELGVYTFTWTMDGSQIGTGTTLALTDAHVGKEVIVTATAQGYYEGSASYTVTAIAPELPSVTQIINATAYSGYFDLSGLTVFGGTTELTYDAAQHDVTLLQKSATLNNTVVGTITVKYNGSTEIPVKAGLYSITVDVATPDLSRVNESGVTVYSPATGIQIGTLKINKAPYHVTVTVADKEYDGFNTASAASVNESGAMELAGGVMDDVAFDASRAVYTFADANVGTGKTVAVGGEKLKGSAADNYELDFTLANGAKADITPRTLEVRIDPVAREYQENYYDVDLAFVVNAATIAPADTSASVYVNEAAAAGRVDDYHAGLRRVTVTGLALAGAKKDNYELSVTNLADLSVMIEKATPSYPLPYTGTVTYDSGRTLSNISLGDSRWAWASTVANTIPEAGTHTFTAVYTPDDQDNYAAVNYEVSLEVRKAPVVIKAASFTTVYGDYAPTYYYTVTGLTGADSIKTSVGGYVIMSCAYEPGSNVDNYPIVLSGGFTSNNYSFTYQNGTLSITPRPAYVTAIAESRPYEEGNTNVNVTFSELSNIYAGDASNVYLGGTQPVVGTIADANAGTKTVTYAVPELAGDKAGNYALTLLNPELKVEITKAALEGVILPTSGTVKYGAKLSTTEFTSSYAGQELGTFSMENPMGTAAAVGTTSNVYKVVFTPFNTINYATISDYITLTVTTADLNVELSMAGSAEVGKKLYVTTNDLPADAAQYIEFKWYRMSERAGDVANGTLVASGTTEYTCVERDADHYIVCVAVNKANSPYNINAKVASDSSVKQQSMSLWQRLLKWFYRVISSMTQLFSKIGH